MAIVWIFLDGVGLGSDNSEINPWAGIESETLIACESRPPSWPGAVWKPLDAGLGVPGLPQSATGTTALFTGVNAPAAIGRHLSGFPPRELQEIISVHSVHRQAQEHGFKSTFANAYNEAYFRRPLYMQSVSTHAVRAAGIPFRMLDDYRDGRAVFHDLTGEMIRSQGNDGPLQYPGAPPAASPAADAFRKRFERIHQRAKKKQAKSGHDSKNTDTHHTLEPDSIRREDLPIIGPEEAARRIASLANDHDIVLFEYIKTDLAGHSMDRKWAGSVVDEVMLFLTTLLQRLDRNRDTLLIASDHGNSEDLSIRTHTYAPVPAVAVGPAAETIVNGASAITDLVPAILHVLEK